MSNQNLLDLFTQYLKEESLNEATTTSTSRGSYKPPVRPGLTYWDPEDLQPYTNPTSKYVNAEINYDSLDGDISTPKKEIAKKEKIAKKLQKKDFIQDSADEGDDEYAYAPFKVLTPSYRKKGDKSSAKPRIKDESHYSAPFTNLDELNEAAGSAGEYNGPIEIGMKKWKKSELGPFNEFVKTQINKKKVKSKLKNNIERVIGMWEKGEDGTYDIETEDTHTIKEDLAVWFGTKKKPKGSKQPKGPWVNICRKKEGGGHPPCGRPEADSKSYPKCRAAGVASKMTDAQKRAACQQKRREEKKNPKTGTGNSPTMVSYKPKKKSQNESVLKNLILKVLKGK
jgi:hypothetical protein